jgi:hypothetical protein
MTNPFLPTILIIMVVTAVAIVIVLVWLVRSHLKLKHNYRILADIVHGHNNDIADLCTAVLTADGSIAATNEQLYAQKLLIISIMNRLPILIAWSYKRCVAARALVS